MDVDRREAARIAELARLALDDRELDALAADLGRILDHVRVLQGVVRGGGDEAADEPGVTGLGPEKAAPTDGHDGAFERSDPGSEGRGPPGAGGPDPLVLPLARIAPDFRDGFFVVPPPPGVHAGEDEA